MRITVELDDDLVFEAKRSAAASGVGFDACIEHQLREWLAEQLSPAAGAQGASQAGADPDLVDVDPSSASTDGT